jgi:DNA-binding transcriptional LysR family regulator
MRLDQLRSFESVVRLGTFTAAAEEQFLTQPSLSRQISGLETELGVELLHRGRTGAALTAAGEVLLPTARRMLADAETARRDLADLAGLRRGRVRVGAPPTLCVSLVAEVLAEFTARHPGVEVRILEAGNRDLVRALEGGELDLALVVPRGPTGPLEGTELVPLLSEHLVVVASVSTELPARITLAQLAGMPQVAFHRGYDLRLATDAAFREAGLEPTIVVEGAEMDAVLRFVERGVGVAVVPAMVVADRAGLRSAPVIRPILERTVELARRSDRRASAAVAAFEALTLSLAAETALPGVTPVLR